MLVEELMSRDPVVVAPEDSLLHARNLMRQANLRHLPVLRDGRLDGVITDRDIRDYMPSRDRALSIYELGANLEHIRVEAVMSRHPSVAKPREPIAAAAARMLAHGIGCLPVVDHERLVGVLTATDVLRMVSGHRRVS